MRETIDRILSAHLDGFPDRLLDDLLTCLTRPVLDKEALEKILLSEFWVNASTGESQSVHARYPNLADRIMAWASQREPELPDNAQCPTQRNGGCIPIPIQGVRFMAEHDDDPRAGVPPFFLGMAVASAVYFLIWLITMEIVRCR